MTHQLATDGTTTAATRLIIASRSSDVASAADASLSKRRACSSLAEGLGRTRPEGMLWLAMDSADTRPRIRDQPLRDGPFAPSDGPKLLAGAVWRDRGRQP